MSSPTDIIAVIRFFSPSFYSYWSMLRFHWPIRIETNNGIISWGGRGGRGDSRFFNLPCPHSTSFIASGIYIVFLDYRKKHFIILTFFLSKFTELCYVRLVVNALTDMFAKIAFFYRFPQKGRSKNPHSSLRLPSPRSPQKIFFTPSLTSTHFWMTIHDHWVCPM